mmetsp:Transcript_23848/g.54126  ORF Transcript_23848/g.54126 Transcript_23848/m.54126 type:complete len:239 (+) Transcript_23848:531-1247(+)
MVDGIKKVLRKVLDTVMSPIREVKTSAQGSGMHASIFLANFDADAQLFRHDVPVHALLAVGTGDCVVLMPEIGRVLHDLVKIRSCRDNNLTAIFPWWRNLLIEFVIRCTRVIDLRVSAGADLERVGIAVDQICGSLERGHFLLVREVLPLFAHFDFFSVDVPRGMPTWRPFPEPCGRPRPRVPSCELSTWGRTSGVSAAVRRPCPRAVAALIPWKPSEGLRLDWQHQSTPGLARTGSA